MPATVETPAREFLFTNDTYLPARKVWDRYGVTSMTLYRWLRDPRMGFPSPSYFGRFRYWKLNELRLWEREQATRCVRIPRPPQISDLRHLLCRSPKSDESAQ